MAKTLVIPSILRANLTLPVKYNNIDIVWSSSNESLLSNKGIVVRPAIGGKDETVVLSALFSKDGVSVTKTYEITVPVHLNDLQSVKYDWIIKEASKTWDGGFCIIGSTGSGESFVFKDRWGIRPCSYYMDDEIVVVASEKAVIQTAMNVPYHKVKELGAGEAIRIKRYGTVNRSQNGSVNSRENGA